MRDIADYDQIDGHWFIDSGSPHLIVTAEDIERIDLMNVGRNWRYDSRFKAINGTNVNFVNAQDSQGVFDVRTYERGVENETLSCGTGVTAVALALALDRKASGLAKLGTRGGALSVKFELANKVFTNIWLQGPAEKLFTGTFHA